MTITIAKVKEHYGFDFYVYQGSKLIRVCPSEALAKAVAAKLAA